MSTRELHAYIQGPILATITKWIESIVTDLERKETFEMTDEIGLIIVSFDCKYDFMLLEQHVGTGWIELTIRPKSPDSNFSDWDNIHLGESLVDDLGGITLVDCGGKYVDPLAPFSVRISADKMELVYLPVEIGDPFDETLTKFIQIRYGSSRS